MTRLCRLLDSWLDSGRSDLRSDGSLALADATQPHHPGTVHILHKNGTGQRFHFHFWSCRRMRITHIGPYHTRPASTNTQLSSAASWLLNDCWFLLQINASVFATVGDLGELPVAFSVYCGNYLEISLTALIIRLHLVLASSQVTLTITNFKGAALAAVQWSSGRGNCKLNAGFAAV